MIPASTVFHEAVKAGAKQRTLLYFMDSDRWFTSKDIGLDNFRYESYFMSEEDVQYGLTPSARIAFTLFNDDGVLDDFGFGWFTVYRGVNTASFKYSQNGNTQADVNGIPLSGHDTVPYLRNGDSAYPVQPAFPVKSIIAIDGVIMCLGASRQAFIIVEENAKKWQDLESQTWYAQEAKTWDSYRGTLTTRTVTITDPDEWDMVSRFVEKNTGVILNHTDTGLDVALYENGTGSTYEYIPIGQFYADRPSRTHTREITVEGHDAMYVSTDGLIENFNLSFPFTITSLISWVCTRLGLQSNTGSILNGSKTIYETDLVGMLEQGLTYRELLAYIAEATGAIAVIDYDGKLKFKWFETTDFSISESDYIDFVPMEYEANAVSRLQIRNSDSEVLGLAGTGTNDYVIQNNPLLLFETSAQADSCANTLYTRISGLGDYVPSAVDWFGDPAVQAGDIISVQYKSDTYRMPIFTLDQTWKGLTTGTAECTGNELREVIDMTDRANYDLYKRVATVEKSLDPEALEQKIASVTKDILGANGGYVRLLDLNGDDSPDTLYIADNYEPSRAVKVWRFNYEGWGASKNGFNGPFTLGATLESGIVAEFITAGFLSANRIQANSISVSKLTGSIKDSGKTWEIDLDTGSMTIGKLAVGKITGTISSSSAGATDNWGIDFTNGKMTIGELAVGKITGNIQDSGKTWNIDFNAGTMTIGKLAVGKITGTISSSSAGATDNWGIDFTNGKMTIGELAVGKITGTIKKTEVAGGTNWEINFNDGTMTIGSINADKITAGTLNAARISAGTITLAKLQSSTSTGDGVVKLSNTGLEIAHTSVGTSSKTTIKADGLKVYNSSGTLIGGLYVPTGQTDAKMGAGSIFNPAYPNFSIQVERFWDGAEMAYAYGMSLYRKNTKVCGIAAWDSDNVNDGTLFAYNGSGVAISSIVDVTKRWDGYDPSQFIQGGGSGEQLTYCNGSGTVNGTTNTHITFPVTFDGLPSICCTYAREGDNQTGTIGPLKVYHKTATGFDVIIGGSATDKDFDWIAIGRVKT